jgi:hypothetical protein
MTDTGMEFHAKTMKTVCGSPISGSDSIWLAGLSGAMEAVEAVETQRGSLQVKVQCWLETFSSS